MDTWLRDDLLSELIELDARRAYIIALLGDNEKATPGLNTVLHYEGEKSTPTPPMASNLSEILEYLETPQPKFLGFETATCWVLQQLLEGDTYPSVLVSLLEERHPNYRLSETVLQKAINFLDQQGVLTCYSQQTGGRGRPRRMLSLSAEYRKEAEALVEAFSAWAV